MGLNNGRFAIMTSLPEKGNKFYNTTGNGGYSRCVQGNPAQNGRNVYSNCVGHACSRFNYLYSLLTGYKGMKFPYLNCNAENFIERAKNTYGLEVKPYPVLGGIMVWQKGATLSGNDGAGHVAFVEDIHGANDITTSDSGWKSPRPFWTTRRNNSNGRWGAGSGYKFRGCIVNPAIGDVHWDNSSSSSQSNIDNKTIEELAKEVIDGKYGNGDARKKALGTRYSEVQARVNQILAGKNTSSKPSKPSLLEMVKRTIRGDFGNYPIRKTKIEALGWDYATVQHQVNENVKRGNWSSNSIKLY